MLFPLNGTVVPPSAPVTGVGSVAEGGTAYIEGTFMDLGTADSHEALIDWGDGTTTVASVSETVDGEGSFFGRHTYARAGVYKVSVTLADFDEGADTLETVAYVTGAAVHDGVLHIVGTQSGDAITVASNGATGQVDVTANFLAGTRSFDPDLLSGAVIFAGEGEDNVAIAADVTLPSLILGGGGSDQLHGGGADDVLVGGPGEDAINGRGGADLQFGGSGDDSHDGGEDDDAAIFGLASTEYDPKTLSEVSGHSLGMDSLVNVEHLIFDDTDDSFFSSSSPWAHDVVARLQGPASEIREDDAAWLLFD